MKAARVFATIVLSAALLLSPGRVLAEGAPDVDQFYQTNDILFYDPNAIPCVTAVDYTTTSGSTAGISLQPGDLALKGNNNAEKVMNFLLGQGFNLGAAAGMMGNFSVESGFNPEAVNPDGGAYGLAQWLNERKASLKEYSSDNFNTLEIQLQYLMFELSGTEKAAMAVKNETIPSKAALVWEKLFERSGSVALGERSKRAEAIFDQWKKQRRFQMIFSVRIIAALQMVACQLKLQKYVARQPEVAYLGRVN